jgi:hypothetical protein
MMARHKTKPIKQNRRRKTMAIDYTKTNVGDKLRIVGAGAPGFAKLGDIVTVTAIVHNRVDVVHDVTGDPAYFALTCGAARLEPIVSATDNQERDNDA